MSGSQCKPTALDLRGWSRSSKRLGRSHLDPAHVAISRSRLSMRIPAGTLDGGEVESDRLFGYGGYRARMKLPEAQGSITGFFLYQSPDFQSEIDVEIYNDSTGQVLLGTYADGVQTNSEITFLGFDPTADFHEYGFDFYPEDLTFSVDGERRTRWSGGLPGVPMKLYLNVWFPQWLVGTSSSSDRSVFVERIRHHRKPTANGHST